jgi:hypothetical protein
VATEKDLAFLRIAIPSHYAAPADLFVYEASPSTLLLQLPVRKKFLVDDRTIGILRHAHHYLMASLIVSEAASNADDDNNVPLMAKLCVYCSKSKKKEWQVSR